MGIRRDALSFEKDFVRIPNSWMRDRRLSRRARGLLAELMTHRVGWTSNFEALEAAGPEGRDALRTAVNELKRCGYLRIEQTRRDGSNTFGEVEYVVCEPAVEPVDGFSGDRLSRSTDSPDDGEPAAKKTNSKEDQSKKTKTPVVPAEDDPIDLAFLHVWQLWPVGRRGTKKKSGSSFRTAVRAFGGASKLPELVAHVEAHTRAWATWSEHDQQYVPGMTTWLNQERWTLPVPKPRTQSGFHGIQSVAEQLRREEADAAVANSRPALGRS